MGIRLDDTWSVSQDDTRMDASEHCVHIHPVVNYGYPISEFHLLHPALHLAREHAPPEVQLLNQLFEADYPDGTQRILEQNQDRLDDDFLKLLDAVVQDLASQGRQQDVNTVQLIRAQAKAMIGD